MHRLNRHFRITIGCVTLGCAGAAFGASSIPTLGELHSGARAEGKVNHLQQVAPALVRESNDEVRFRYFADLFLGSEEHDPPAGLAANVTAAIFGQGERRPGQMVFTGGGPLLGGGGGGQGGALFLQRSSLPSAGVVNRSLPGGGGSISGGGGGGGGFAGGGSGDASQNASPPIASAPPSPPSSGSANGNNSNIVSFTDSPPNNNHPGGCCCCCCCPGFNMVAKPIGDPHDAGPQNGPSGGGDHGGNTTAIPLPAPLWLGLVGLLAVGWMRRRSIVT